MTVKIEREGYLLHHVRDPEPRLGPPKPGLLSVVFQVIDAENRISLIEMQDLTAEEATLLRERYMNGGTLKVTIE
jgi:ribosomal protein L10